MLLTITTTHRPATDLGYLLVKNPARCQSFDLAFGKAHVFYPVAREDVTTAALLLDLDPIGLVRGARGGEGAALGQYVNDRPYVASSFLSVAIAQVLGSALKGASRDRPELAASAIPLACALPVVRCRGGEGFLRALFEPLGYAVTARRLALDERFPAWGESSYYEVGLAARTRLALLLAHLYVLLPVLDDDKHYWVGAAELEKLLAHGGDWLAAHPAREAIVERYLKRQPGLVAEALARLVADDDPDPEEAEERRGREEDALEEKISLDEARRGAVLAVLRERGAKSVIDLGCGEGKLLQALLRDPAFERVAGMDVSHRALQLAVRRLRYDQLPPAQRARIELFQGALTYRDARLAGYDAAVAVEVIEHLDPERLPAFERVVFGSARPRAVVLTTPNAEYNPRFAALPAGRFRHRDHRFEWTRAELRAWADAVAARHGYAVRYLPVGAVDPDVGAPTQLAAFTL